MLLRKKSQLVGLLATGGASLALLAMASVGYSAWSSVLPETSSISTVPSIPAPTNVEITPDDATQTYNITWTIPSGSDYDGNPLAQGFEIQGSSSPDGPWTTLGQVSGSTDTYSTPATSAYADYRIVTVNHGWLSSYVTGNQTSPTPSNSISAPPTSVTTETFNPPPDYCGFEYICSLPQNATWVVGSPPSVNLPVSNETSMVMQVPGYFPYSGTDGGVAPGPGNPSYGYIGLTSPTAIFQLPNWYPILYQDVYTFRSGYMQTWPDYCNPAVGGIPPGGYCPQDVAYFVYDPEVLPAVPGPQDVFSTQYGNVTYQPECSTQSGELSNLQTCVLDFDPYYQEYTTTTTTIN